MVITWFTRHCFCFCFGRLIFVGTKCCYCCFHMSLKCVYSPQKNPQNNQTNKGKNSYGNKEIMTMRGKKRQIWQCGCSVCCHLTLTLPFHSLSNVVCLLGSAFSINQFVFNPLHCEFPRSAGSQLYTAVFTLQMANSSGKQGVMEAGFTTAEQRAWQKSDSCIWIILWFGVSEYFHD